MSYAEIASLGPRQTPEEAAAPQPPQIDMSESTTSSSLIDVDTPSVRTVPSDFAEQEIQTETQAARIEHDEREKELAAKARAGAESAKKVRVKTIPPDNWLTKKFAGMSDGASSALVVSNWVGVVALSGWLGFKAWGLYDRGRLDWRTVGLGLGLIGAVGAVESFFAGYLKKARGGKKQ